MSDGLVIGKSLQACSQIGDERVSYQIPPDPAHQLNLRSVQADFNSTLIFTGLIFEKAKPDLRREEEPRFGDFSRRSC